MTLYAFLFRHVIARLLDAERAHAWAMRALRLVAHRRVLGRPIAALLRPRDRRLAVEALGRVFPSPLGVAAGMDKTAETFDQLAALGFGFVEVGTVTARPQDGNPPPRVWRLLEARAVINAMGFPNPGAEAVARRLRRVERETIVGVNIGKSRAASLDEANADFGESVERLAPVADYLVLNVSSPNTPGLRDLQAVDRLAGLVDAVRERLRTVQASVPVLVKIAPDLTDHEIDAIADFALEHGLDGIIAVNTTVSRDLAEHPDADRPGGLSGAPLKPRALEVLRRLHGRVGESVPLISVGGIETADDAWERITAGATLLQAHTGFVFGGPLWPRHINDGLLARLSASGATSLAEVRRSTNGRPGFATPASLSRYADARR